MTTKTSATTLDLACAGTPGTSVRIALTARDAVRILQDRNTQVRAVLTDIRMPIMDGFQLIEFVRAHSRHAATPIIVVTADTDPDTPGRVSRLGGNAASPSRSRQRRSGNSGATAACEFAVGIILPFAGIPHGAGCGPSPHWAFSALPACAQAAPDLRQILERLDRLEAQNRTLEAEVRDLKVALAAAQGSATLQTPAQPTAAERLDVEESRTNELAASKVEAANRFPIRITGMALFNSFLNSKGSGGVEYPTSAQPGKEASGGATVRQTILGLDYNGPTALGAKIGGSLRLDLWAGGIGQPLDQTVRVRTAILTMDWKNTGLLMGVDKPIVAPRDPESLAQVAFSPLTTGNLWLWSPQVRLQQDIHFGDGIGLRFQAGVVQTHEVSGSPASPYFPAVLRGCRVMWNQHGQGGEGRLELFAGTTRRFEIAGANHRSVSQVLGKAVPSDVYAIDWLARPWQAIEFTGTAFHRPECDAAGDRRIFSRFRHASSRPGQRRSQPGRMGSANLPPGYAFVGRPMYSGQQDDRNSDLPRGGIGKNLIFGANLFYRLAPNVVVGVESTQTRTNYIGSGTLLNNHYDLAFAYMF